MRPRTFLSAAIILVFILTHLATPGKSAKAAEAPLKIGVASMITPVDAVKYYQDVIDYIGEQLGMPVQMVHRRTYDEMDMLLESGEVKVAFICSAPYVKNRKKFGIDLLVAPKVNGKAVYQSYIIVHKDDPAQSFSDLKGKVFAFTDPKSNTGKLYPIYLLKTMKSSPERFFKRYLYSYSHNKSVELVAKKVSDAAAVESIVYEHMLKKGSPYARQVRVIQRSPPFGIPPVVVRQDVDPGLRTRLQNAFLNMHRSEKGKDILDAMMVDGFAEIADSAYDSIREMERVVTDDAKVARKARGKQTVNFGVIPRDNPRILYEKYQPLLDYLAERTPFAYELIIKRTYEETVTALGSGEIDVALLGPLTYLEARAKYDAVCILKPRGASGAPAYRSVIIKRKDAPIKSTSDLRGKSVAFSSFKSTSGNLIPRYLLAGSGIHLSDLGNYANFDYHDSVLKAVLKGQYDAGAVRDSVAHKYSKLGIEVIAESEPIPTGPLVVGPGTSFVVTEKIRSALLELDPRDAVHQKVLGRLDDDLKNGFMPASDDDYAGIRASINAVPQTCGKGCHPKIRL